MWCTDTVVLTQEQLEKKSRFILSDWSNFLMIDNLVIADHTFAWRMLTSLSVDKILLLRDVNKTSNSRACNWEWRWLLLFQNPFTLFYLHIYVEANASCCLQQALQLGFSLVINIIWICYSSCWISSSCFFFFSFSV